MSTEYFIKATEHSLDVVYVAEGENETTKVTIPRGQAFQFFGDIVSQWPTPGAEILSQDGMAGNGRVTLAPPIPTPPTEIIPVPEIDKTEEVETDAPEPEEVTPPVVEEAPAPKRKGPKTKAEKAAIAAAEAEAAQKAADEQA